MKTIIILGTGSSCRFCDFKADEVWGVNGAWTIKFMMPEKYQEHFHMEKLFMMDYLWSSKGVMNFDIDVLNKFCEEHNIEMVSLHNMKIGKYKVNARRYPYHNVVDYFGTDYFTDTITYMLAYALYKNTYLAQNEDGTIRPELKEPLVLRLFGVDMATTLEYQVSKGGVEFWLGQARTMGCEIQISPGSTILANPRGVAYGWKLKYDLSKIDPYNLLGNKKRKFLTGSDKIDLIGKESPNEQMYQDEIR